MAKSFCIDIGGTAIKSAFILKNKIKDYSEIKTPKSKKEFLSSLVNIINEKTSQSDKVKISIASPIISGKLLNPPHLPLKNFNLSNYLAGKTKRKIFVENDARCCAIAVNKINNKKNFVLITLGTGIGGAIFLNGKLYRGKGYAGELGHILVENQYLENAWKSRDKELKYLAEAIVSIKNSIDPESIIFATRVVKNRDIFLYNLKKEINKHDFNKTKTNISFLKINNPELIGASYLK